MVLALGTYYWDCRDVEAAIFELLPLPPLALPLPPLDDVIFALKFLMLVNLAKIFSR